MNMRKAAGLALLGVAWGLWACSSPPAEERFQKAAGMLRDRQYEKALAEVDDALGQLSPQQTDAWAWRLRLLKAEILIAMKPSAKPWDRDAEIAALLAQPAPLGSPEARRTLLQGKRSKANGDYLNAERLFQQARRHAESLENWSLLTEVEYELAGLRNANLEYEQALQVMLPLTERPLQDIAPDQLTRSMLRISFNYIQLQQWGPARDWAERAHVHTRRGGDQALETIRLLNLATAQNRLGYSAAAKGNLDEAMKLAESSANQYLAKIHQELGNNAFFEGRYEEAFTQYRLAEQEQSDPTFIYNQFVTLMEMEECTKAREIWAYYRSFTDSPSALESTSETDIWRDLLNQGRLQHICGELDQAQESYQRLVREAPEKSYYRLRSLSGLGLLADEQQRPEEADHHFEAAIRMIQEIGRSVPSTVDGLAYFSAMMDVYRNYVHALLQQNDPPKALEVADSSRGFIMREKLDQAVVLTGKTELFRQMSRRSDVVYLFYWVSGDDCYAWVLKGGELIPVRLSIQAKQLRTQIRRYSEELVHQFRDPDGMTSGFQLAEVLLTPVLNYIPSGSHVVLILDDYLHGLSFDTLPVGSPGSWHYWIEDATLSIAPSLSQMAFSKRRSSPPASDFLLVGNPKYANPEDDLGSAGQEISNIRGHLEAAGLNVLQRTGEAARVADVMQLLTSTRGLHVAAHAVVEPFQPLDSAILLTPAGTVDKLYARQILELAPLQLNPVVLSACETAGDYSFSGEGPVGLAWAFMAAGSCDVVATIWEVPDRSAQELMDAFYANLAQGRPYAQALREAKLQFIDRMPVFWGGFQHYLGCPEEERRQETGGRRQEEGGKRGDDKKSDGPHSSPSPVP